MLFKTTLTYLGSRTGGFREEPDCTAGGVVIPRIDGVRGGVNAPGEAASMGVMVVCEFVDDTEREDFEDFLRLMESDISYQSSLPQWVG